MGVDIWFSAEVRRKNKWKPLIWYRKHLGEDEEHSYSKPDSNGMVAHYSVYGGRAYHYRDVLEDMKTCNGYPDDLSEDLKARLPNGEYVSKGYFMLDDLEKYIDNEEKKMLRNLLESRDNQLVKHIQRIEKAVLNKPIKEKIKQTYLADYSMKELYEEYMEDMYRLVKLRDVVYYLADEFFFVMDSDDIRITYHQC